MTFFSIFFRVLMKHSTSPSVCGWYTLVLTCSIRKRLHYTRHECGALVVRISHGIPTQLNIRKSSRVIPFAAAVRNGIASGYRVAYSTVARMYWCPLGVFTNGLTRSKGFL